MSWATKLQQPSFRGITFDVLSTSDPEARAVAAHELPYRSGADVEDLGLRPRRFQLVAQLRGEDYEQRLDGLLQALRIAAPGTLVHPIFGTLTVVALEWETRHEADSPDCCQLTLSFLEVGTFEPLFSAPSPIASADRVDAATAKARARSEDGVTSILESIAGGPLPRVVEINAAFSRARSVLTKLVDTTSVKLLLSDLDPLLHPRAALGDLATIVDQAFQGISFGGLNGLFNSDSSSTSVPAALDDFNRVAAQLDATRAEVRASTAEPQEVAVCAALTAHVRTLAAGAVSQAAGIVYAGELDALVLDRGDIERVAGLARAGLQAAITASRAGLDREHGGQAAAQLATAAHEIQEGARALIQLRPPVVRRAAPVGGPMRLVAHALYGDHTRAPELARLNRIGRRVLLDRGEEVLAYAR